jgi:hypothetical protein
VVCEVLLVQRLGFIGVAVLSILVLTIVGAVSLSPAYASLPPATMTLNMSPNPALPGQAVTFSGQVNPPKTGADTIQIYVLSGELRCAPLDTRFVWLAVNLAPSTLTPSSPTPTFTGTANSAGFYSITGAAGLPADAYTVYARDTSYVGVASTCDPLTVAPPIPEYPLGVAVLAAFIVITYGVIRRKTVTKLK